MRFAPWSAVYLLPAALYAVRLVARRQRLLDPLLFGGVYLALMFLLYDPHGSVVETPTLVLLHLAASGAYWGGGLWAARRARLFRLAHPAAPRFLMRPRLWMWLAAATWTLALVIFTVLFEGSVETMMAMRNRPELMLGSVVSEASTTVRLAQYLRGYLFAAALMTLFLWCRRPSLRPLHLVLLLGTLAAAGAVLAASGSRGSVLFFGLHSLFILHYALRDHPGIRRAAKMMILAGMPIVVVTILVQTLYRDTGLEGGQAILTIEDRAQEAVSAIFEHLSFNDEIQFVLSTYTHPETFIRGHSLLTPLVVFVPRTMWPEKPIPWGRELAWQYGYQFDTTVSLAASIIGEGYANFGLAGWILFPFVFGSVVGWTSYFLKFGRADSSLLWGLWGLHWAFALRGDIHTVISASIVPALVMLLVIRWAGLRAAVEKRPAPAFPDWGAARGWRAGVMPG